MAMAVEETGFEIRDMINWTYTQSMPKGMSVNHIIEKILNESEKDNYNNLNKLILYLRSY